MTRQSKSINQDPWELVWGQPYIDSDMLSSAIEWELLHNPQPDFRTRLLIRDAVEALQSFLGQKKFAQWLRHSPVQARIEAIVRENLGEPGFHNIRSRLVANIKRSQLEQMFELLGRKVQHETEVYIGGSIPTLIEGLTARPTDDIYFVDEVPAEIREQRTTVEQIEAKYGFTLGHVQSHYLPANWKERREYLGDFGKLRVYFVDKYDIFVSKLSSKQEKHQDDLMVLAAKLDKEQAKQRLLTDGKALLESAIDRLTIEENWRFLYREPLFSGH